MGGQQTPEEEADPDPNQGHAPRVVVRPAEAPDFAPVANIYRAAIASRVSTMDTEAPNEASIAARCEALGPREALLVARRHERVLGFGWLRLYSPRPGYRFACETSVYVDGEYSGRGVGTATQTALLEQARENGFRYVVAKALSVNEASVGFHRRFGFKIVGTQRGIGDLDGVSHDIVILELKL